jgi:hypothetical protein
VRGGLVWGHIQGGGTSSSGGDILTRGLDKSLGPGESLGDLRNMEKAWILNQSGVT